MNEFVGAKIKDSSPAGFIPVSHGRGGGQMGIITADPAQLGHIANGAKPDRQTGQFGSGAGTEGLVQPAQNGVSGGRHLPIKQADPCQLQVETRHLLGVRLRHGR